jgi:hypothetical protein
MDRSTEKNAFSPDPKSKVEILIGCATVIR